MAFAIGIDASTQSVKAVAFGPDGTQLGLGRIPLNLDEPRPGWAEQDPQDWYDAMVGALRDLGRHVDLGQATGLAITCQRDTVVLLDAHFRAVRPAFVWLDNRAADQVRRFGPLGVHEITGK
ncbi:MAG: xylulokinase, partial [Streptomycetaceae bacterium]|nr:xylulokinase [Streptomycetaceae bacterium]